MIAYLKGKILQKGLQFLIVEHQGIGYRVLVTPDLLDHPIGETIELYTHLKSGEDGQTLFGLKDFPSLQFFELLISVTGVGPKMALTIVSAARIDVLQQAIANRDAEIFTRMSGVGKKTADRIILELKTKIAGGMLSGAPLSGNDLYDALIGLGYNPREVREVMGKVDGDADTQTQLKQALKLLSM
jgi:holliday junction DNA helicase RuvA